MKYRLIILLFFNSLLFSAQSLADSLLVELSKTTNDTTKARIYIKLVDYYQQTNPEKSLKFANEGLKIVKKLNWEKGYAVYYNDIGSTYLSQTKYKEALLYLKKSLDYSNDLASIRCNTLHNITIIYTNHENFELSKKYNTLLYKLAKENNIPFGLACSFSNFGEIYEKQKNHKKAKHYFSKALPIWQTINDSVQEATTLMNLGELENNIALRIDYYNKSKKIWDKVDSEHIVAISNQMGLAEEYVKLTKNDSLYKISKINLSKNELIDNAFALLQNAVNHCKKTNAEQNLIYAYEKLYELEEARGNYKKALEYSKLNHTLYTSFFSQENKNKLAKVESQKIIDLKNQEIKLKMLEKRNQKIYFSVGIILLSIIGFLLFYQSKNRKKANEILKDINAELDIKNEQLDTANKNKAKLLSILNHDLRAPVANLIDFLHIQKDNPELLDEQTKKKYEASTIKNAENLLSSMEDLLLWSKSQMAHFKPKIQPVTIQNIFDDVKKHFDYNQKIQFTLVDKNKVCLNSDIDYLKIIVRNITSNAIKALENTANAQILYTAWQDQNHHFLSIQDNGFGISKDSLNQLLSTNNIGTKSGLGLHLVLDLAKAINCKLSVDSKENLGTIFTLQFEKN